MANGNRSRVFPLPGGIVHPANYSCCASEAEFARYMQACIIENNVSPGHVGVTKRTGVALLRIQEVRKVNVPETETVFILMMCMQCEIDAPLSAFALKIGI